NLFVGAPSGLSIPHGALEPARGDPKYSNYEAFLSSLGTLALLKNLRIKHIPFFDVDINRRLGEVACRLPRLKTLFLHPHPQLPSLDTLKRISFRETAHPPGLQKPTSTTKLELVQYLYRLFPQLETLAAGWKRDSEEWQYWTEMEQLLSFSRNLRSQLVQDLANSANTSQANS
ncbi:hypothetical protein DFP72DRAFT_858212, partial [Ephemerocybe angulata]